MPIIKSAKKRVKQIQKRTARNRQLKNELKAAIKDFEQTLEANDLDIAREKLNAAKSTIDKSVKKGLIHKNNAARKKSRLERAFARIAKEA